MMSEILKSCPFCGGEPEIRGITQTEIRCTNDQCISAGAFNDYGHRHDAIAAWNRRALSASPSPQGEAVAWRYRQRDDDHPGWISKWQFSAVCFTGNPSYEFEPLYASPVPQGEAVAVKAEYCQCKNSITASPCIICGLPKFIDPVWLKRKIEETGDEGEIGAGFEPFELPASPRDAVTAPEGMVLVPKEPTEAMLRAFAGISEQRSRYIWDAMLATAPSQEPAAPESQGGSQP